MPPPCPNIQGTLIQILAPGSWLLAPVFCPSSFPSPGGKQQGPHPGNALRPTVESHLAVISLAQVGFKGWDYGP